MNLCILPFRNSSSKVLCIIALLFCQLSWSTHSLWAIAPPQQEKKITLNLNDVTLIKVFDEIKKQSSYSFWYRNDDININEKISIKVTDKTIAEVLDQVLKNKNLKYEIKEQHIVISKTDKSSDASSNDNQQKGKKIEGIVKDETGETLIGVSVRAKNAPPGVGVVTNIDGKYSLNIDQPGNTVLIFSYLGYKTKEVPSNGKELVDVTLEEDVQMLGEVVVTGYQTISRERSTASYVILDNKELTKNVTINALSALQGKAAGVNTYNDNVVIRGNSTFSDGVGTKPLLVVDGLPTERSLSDYATDDIESLTVLKDASATSIYGVRAANGVIVLTTKKADKGKLQVNFSSTITVTPQWDLSDYRYASVPEILDFAEKSYQGNIRRQSNGEAGYFTAKGTIGSNNISYYSPFEELHRQLYLGNISQNQFDQQINTWKTYDYRQEYQDLATQTPIGQNYNLSIAKESGGLNTYLSVGYTNNNTQQIQYNNGEALKAYLKVGMKLTDWLTANVGIDTRYSTSEKTDATSQTLGLDMEPYTKILNDDGSLNYREYGKGSGSYGINPQVLESLANDPNGNLFKSYRYNILDELDKSYTNSEAFSIRSFFDLKFNIWKGLSYTSSFSYEMNKSRSDSYLEADAYDLRFFQNETINPNAQLTQPIPNGDRYTRSQGGNTNYTFRNQVDYNLTLKEKHAIVALAGLELREQNNPLGTSRTLYGYDKQTLSYQFLDERTWDLTGYPSYIYSSTNGNMVKISKSMLKETLNRFVSFYGNASYMFDGKYGVSGSIRVDETNLFTKDPKYKYRPLWSLGATWNMKREDFMKDINWLDVLKLRATYGVNGNVDPNSTPYLVGTAMVAGYRITPTRYVSIDKAPNPLLRWEKTTTYDLGFDYSMFNSKLYGSFDFYYKYSDDLLCYKANDYSSGFGPTSDSRYRTKINNGAMSNTGFEATLKSPWFKKNDWTLNSTLIISYNKNTVEKVGILPTTAEQVLTGGDYFYADYPRSSVYAYRYAGFTDGGTNAQNGIPYVIGADGKTNVVLNPDGTVSYSQLNSTRDIYYTGPAVPPVSINFNQGVKYKDFELNALFMFYGGHKIRRPSVSILTNGDSGNLPEELTQAWTPTNTNTDVPKLYPDYEANQISNLDPYVNKYWQLSDKHIVSGNFVRLSNLTFSYTLPSKIAKSMYMQYVRFSFQVNNPWYWSYAGDGIDPEMRSGSTTSRVLPKQDSYVFRLDVSF